MAHNDDRATTTDEPDSDDRRPGDPTSDGAGSGRAEPGLVRSAAAGLLAAAAALSAGELAAAVAAPRPGPVVAVANRVVDNAPTWFVELGKSVFGLADKPALVLGTVLISLAIAIGLGISSRRTLLPGVIGISGFGLLGMAAIGVDSQGGWAAAVPVAMVAVTTGIGSFVLLMSKAAPGPATAPGHRAAAGGAETGHDSDRTSPIDSPIDPALTRRSFLNVAGTVGVTAAAASLGANLLRSRSSAADARASVRLDPAISDELSDAIASSGTAGVGATPGITPLVVPGDDFYLIDTAVLTPQVDPADWSLTITGMVEQDLTISYQDLLDRATTVEPVTLSCVSNEVGGSLVGNAVWQGVPLTELLDEAGADPDASQIASYSVDGWSCGFPTELAYDGRVALVAVAMNNEPLPLRHGFPARLVVSGLYGYVSATKWLERIELTTLDGFDGYWIPRGWSKLGPVKTQSRIDTPRSGAALDGGETVAIAGVAWAPSVGIDLVEVQIDDGGWREAELGDSLGEHSWRQWLLRWEPTPGEHRIRVRATDSDGITQTSELAPPAPNGATGWHTISVTVT
jgi:DMSO/TMAO reductase YedYZ molybdopterin-dependent catalytic subunit